MFGLMVGSILSGWVNDKFGRKIPTVCGWTIAGILYFCQAFVQNYYVYIAMKLCSTVIGFIGNFAAYTPLLLIQRYLLESTGSVHWAVLALVGTVVFTGRVLHFMAFRQAMNFRLRVLGMQMTLFPLMILSLLNLYAFVLGVI